MGWIGHIGAAGKGSGIGVAMMLVFAAGCGSSTSQETGGDALVALYPRGELLAANHQLIEAETQECMLAQGFDYEPLPFEVDDQVPVDFPTIGNWSVELADEYGFDMAKRPPEQGSAQPLQPSLVDSSPSEIEVYVEAEMACWSASFDLINGAYQDAIRPLQIEFTEVQQAFQADPAIVGIQAEWGDCMRGAGFEDTESFPQFVGSFLDAQNELILAAASGRIGPDEALALSNEMIASERVAALQAVDCAAPHKATYNEVWADYEADFLGQHDVPQIPG